MDMLDCIPGTIVASTNYEAIDFHKKHRKKHWDKICYLDFDKKIECKLVYAGVFLSLFLDGGLKKYIEDVLKTKFVMTLYPGGGMAIGSREYVNRLNLVFNSPYFEGVVITQKPIYEYIVNNCECNVDKIHYVYGGILPNLVLKKEKKWYGINKASLDIAFVAYNYPYAIKSKGYDIFVDVARKLVKKYGNIKFHVVGGFDDKTIDISEIEESIFFYGQYNMDDFEEFFANIDIVLSPTKSPLGHEGFPTGGVAIGGMLGSVAFTSDVYAMNHIYVDGEEMVIIKNDVDFIYDKIEYYYNNPEKLYDISVRGSKKFNDVFNLKSQMKHRIEMCNTILNM